MKASGHLGRLVGHAIVLVPAAAIAAVLLAIVWLSAGALVKTVGTIAIVVGLGFVWARIRD